MSYNTMPAGGGHQYFRGNTASVFFYSVNGDIMYLRNMIPTEQGTQYHNLEDYVTDFYYCKTPNLTFKNIFTALRTCPPGYFQCRNNRCVSSNQTCNQVNDCGDLSDELSCSCSDDHFLCASGQCIHASLRCDNEPDCTDASDEMHCESEYSVSLR